MVKKEEEEESDGLGATLWRFHVEKDMIKKQKTGRRHF